jgi:hypothetical protein
VELEVEVEVEVEVEEGQERAVSYGTFPRGVSLDRLQGSGGCIN